MRKRSLLQSVQLSAGFAFCILWKLFPYRPPNVEPLLAVSMPYAKRFGALWAFLLGFLGIALFDAVTGRIGTWTAIIGLAYGFTSLGGWFYLRHRRGVIHYAVYAVIGTIVFDLVTGVVLSPVFFPMSLREAFVGQIPFTVNHLVSNVILGLALSPLAELFLRRTDALAKDASASTAPAIA